MELKFSLLSCMKTSLSEEKVSCYAILDWSASKSMTIVCWNSFLTKHDMNLCLEFSIIIFWKIKSQSLNLLLPSTCSFHCGLVNITRNNLRLNSVCHVTKPTFTIIIVCEKMWRLASFCQCAHVLWICASCKACFTHHVRAGVGIDAINYATKYATKIEANFFYSGQIKFNEPALKRRTPDLE